VAGDPVEVWFAKRAGNKLGRLRVSDMGSATIYYFRPPSPRDQPQVFEHMSTGSGSQPWDIEVGPDGAPWFIEPHSNRVGNYTPGTLTYFNWYELPVSSSTPYGLDIAQGVTWFTEKDGNRVGQLQPLKGILREFALPGAAPTEIAVDATGCAWIAASNQDKLIRWCPPYFQFAHLPLVRRDK